LIFEDFSDNAALISKAYSNSTDFDFVQYLASQGIDQPDDYYDANRLLKIRDRMTSPDTGLLDKVIARFRAVTSDDLVPSEMIKQSNLMLLELARLPKAKKQEF